MPAKRQDDEWIQDAIKHPGALRERAKRAGALNKDGTIKKSWLDKEAKKPGTPGRQARMALTMRKIKRVA